MKVVVVTDFQVFFRDKSEALSALEAKDILKVLLTIGCFVAGPVEIIKYVLR